MTEHEPKRRRPRGDGALYEDAATGRWIGKVDLGRGPDGKRRQRKVTGRTKSEVARKLSAVRKDVADGLSSSRRAPTLAELAAVWLAEGAPGPRGEKGETTLSRLRPRLELHVLKHFGHLRVDAIGVNDVDAWLRTEAAAGQSIHTLKDYRSDLRQLLTEAERLGHVRTNVAKLSRLPRMARESDPKRSLTVEEMSRLLAALDGDRLGPYFTLLVERGLRPQEADALRWPDVDLDAGTVSIRRAMKRGASGQPLELGDPKTAGSRRTIRLTPRSAAALRLRHRQQLEERMLAGPIWSRDERWSELVFTSEIGTPMHPSNTRRAFAKACERAGIAPLSVYELRHTTASLLVNAGLTAYEVADLLGHTTTRMLDQHYRHRVGAVVETPAIELPATAASLL